MAPGRAVAGDAQGLDLGMRAAESLMPAFADDFAVANDDAADHRVRLDVSLATRRQFERAGHEQGIKTPDQKAKS